MADDNMEIVTDSTNNHDFHHPPEIGDDYLEIDIDLPPESHVDEDDMVDDVFHHGTEGSLLSDHNLENGMDASMIDEDYRDPSNEEVDELMIEEELVDHEMPAHSYIQVDDPRFDTIESTFTVPGTTTTTEEKVIHEAEIPAKIASNRPGDLEKHSPSPLRDDRAAQEKIDSGFQGEVEDYDEQSLFENDISHAVPAITEEEAEEELQEPDHADDADVLHVTNAEHARSPSAERGFNSSHLKKEMSLEEMGLRRIMVMYQAGEHHLFNNGSDDPDQYFVEDLALAGEPLSVMFRAIRDVLEADLTEDEELCISFREFGLELAEVCDDRNYTYGIIRLTLL